MPNKQTIYPDYRHEMVARYGHFRIDRVWFRIPSTDEKEHGYLVVFEVDASNEFDFGRVQLDSAVLSVPHLLRFAAHWLRVHRPRPDGGLVSLACYCRRVGPPDGEHEATPGEWYQIPYFRRPGKPMIDMHEAVPLVEAAMHELETPEPETGDML